MRWFLYFLAVLLCGAANAQTMGGSSSLVIGSTVISGCTSTTGVLFNNNGVPGCDAGLTKAAGASGAVTVGGVFTVQSSILLGGANGSIQIPNGGTYIWGNGTKLTSSSSGVVQFQNNGNTQNFNLSTAANNLASFNGVVGGLGHLSTGVAFASLPTATAGTVTYLTDGLAANCADTTCTTFGTNVTGGGGALKLLVWYNGSNWTLAGK